MALINTTLDLKYEICQSDNCRWLIFNETTGAYNATTNPGGWDATEAVNPDWNNATSASLIVTTPDGDSFTFFDDPAFFWNEGGDFPTDDSTLQYVITAEMLGFDSGDKLPDGMYTFTYAVEGAINSDTYTSSTTCKKLVTCGLDCCLQKLAKEAAKDTCDGCKDNKQSALLKMSAKLLAAKAAAACGMENRANKLIKELNWLCNNYNCNC